MRNPWVIPAARELGYRTVMWTLLPGDWKEEPAEWLIPRLQPIADHAQRRLGDGSNRAAAGTGDVLCLHDGAHRQMNGDRFARSPHSNIGCRAGVTSASNLLQSKKR